MMGVLFGMALAIVVLAGLLTVAGARIERLQTQCEEDDLSEHAKCIAHIADVTSKRVVALALRDLARRWDSVEEKANLNRLGREYQIGGPSVPNVWLNQQADLLDPQDEDSK